MGIIVNYKNENFSNLNNAPQTLLTSSTKTLIVNNITFTNTSTTEIRLSLQCIKNLSSVLTTSYEFYKVLVPTYKEPYDYKYNKKFINTINLREILNGPKTLSYGTLLTYSLVCFSEGPKQLFDVTIDYQELNES